MIFRGDGRKLQNFYNSQVELVNEVRPDFVHLFLGSHNAVEVDNKLANSSQRCCRKQDVGNNWVFALVMCKALGPTR